MFFILSKALLFLLSPFFWLVVFTIGAFALRSARLKRISKWLAISFFLIFSNSFILLEFYAAWEVEGTPIKKVKNYDVGIVLTGMAEYNNDLKVLSIRRGGDRIWQALTLYHSGKIKKILISGDHGYVTDRGLHEAQQFKDVLVKWGIPETDILTENISKNTHENAVESKKVLKKEFAKDVRVLLITSGSHMRRSRACFAHEGIVCDTYSTDMYTGKHQTFYWDQYLIPNVDNFSEWNKLIKEWVGYIMYAISGYL
jgi:uncharacterized SAM-binding protein YcdF (DUF218 family)